MQTAPYFSDIDGADLATEAFWLTADDGLRIRFVLWRGGDAGTIVIFSGRTEYCEKYALVAQDLIAKGYTVATLDWRGQGLSDRLNTDPMLGHVKKFQDYQQDARAALSALGTLKVPKPLFLIGHSMGGCIGLRSLVNGLPFAAAGFSGPMWGIKTEGIKKLVAPFLPKALSFIGLGNHYAPGTSAVSFMMTTPFEESTLTTDPDRLTFMQKQAAHDPRLTLGGPSLHWTAEAFAEMRTLAEGPRPDVPTRTYLGSLEEITDPDAIHAVSANWTSETLFVVDGAKHELMMERAALRSRILDGYVELFDAHR